MSRLPRLGVPLFLLLVFKATAAYGQGSAPTFAKTFSPDEIAPGANSLLAFVIDNTGGALAATGLDFTDTFPAGLVLTDRPPAVTCSGGTLTAVAGTGLVAYSGGTVAAGASCTIIVEVTSATTGTYDNVSGTLASSEGESPSATDTLTVTVPPSFDKSFSPGLILVGGVSTLTFTIDNTGSTIPLTGLSFTDSLPAFLVEVAAPPNASTTCSGGALTASAATGTIFYSGGSLAGSSSCTISVDVTSSTSGVILDVTGTHTNTTSLLATSAGSFGPATANLIIASSVPPASPPLFSKSFSPSSIFAGDSSNLVFTIDNSSNATDATAVDFTDNLPVGVVLTDRAPAITCGGGTLTAVAGAGVVSYTGGTVSALSSCIINVEVTTSTAGTHLNTTGTLTSSFGDSGTATDTLSVGAAPGFTKTFAPAAVVIGGISTLTLVIDNSAGGTDVSSLVLTDNLPAGMEVASTPNASTTCTGGTLTAAAASTTITYFGGTVGAGSTCTVSVDVVVSSAGTFMNLATLTSIAGSSADAMNSVGATGAPGFSKAFAPTSIAVGGISTIIFTIDNSGGGADVGSLSVTDNLPANLEVAAVPNATTTCSGGTLTAAAGATVITYTGGTVLAGTTCTVSVDVTATGAGSFVNTATLTSAAGASPDGTDTLSASTAPGFSKAFAPDSITVGGISTLTLTIDNSGGASDIGSVSLTDNFPAGVEVATTPNATTTCSGGTLTAAAGAGVITYTGGTVLAGTTCTVSVDVTATGAGSFVNTATLTSAAGASPDASDTLDAAAPVPALGPVGAMVLGLLLIAAAGWQLRRRSVPTA